MRRNRNKVKTLSILKVLQSNFIMTLKITSEGQCGNPLDLGAEGFRAVTYHPDQRAALRPLICSQIL